MAFSFDNWINENNVDPDLCEILKGHYIVSETSILGLTEKDLDEIFDGLPKKIAFKASFRLAQRSLAAQKRTNLGTSFYHVSMLPKKRLLISDNLTLPMVEPQLFVKVGLGNSANIPSLSNNIISAHAKPYGLSEVGYEQIACAFSSYMYNAAAISLFISYLGLLYLCAWSLTKI